jgi:hypothetical protein
MSTQRQLTALLHELQHARSPLAQARVLARGWRTVRQLSPTDRRLLARHAGFEGAEDILEGLSQRKGGLAPAMLLRVLSNARGTDGSTVSDLLAAFRDPQRRDEAISRGADLARDLLAEPVTDDGPEEIDEAIEELQGVEESIIETPEEALAALNALEPDPETEVEETPASVSVPEIDDTREAEPVPPKDQEPPPPPPPPLVDWSRWQEATANGTPVPTPSEEMRPPVSDNGSRRFEAQAVMRAMGAEQSVFSQLRVLSRELSGFAGSSIHTLRELIEAFPDGWARRRALCALLGAGTPAGAGDAVELVSCLGREPDRRWCLALLARKGDLRGANLSRALDLVDSGFSKRRLASIAG